MLNLLRSFIYPGLDLHTRDRATMARFWNPGTRDVLDAGSGNGYLSWLAYQSGANVVAMNFEQSQVDRAQAFLVGYRGADPSRLRFEKRNLYDLKDETRTFDEIICSEVLEHIRGDEEIVNQFYRILRPGGVLHLCCPNRMHPRHQIEVLDTEEKGGHVRAGYSADDYQKLLGSAGFRIEKVVGIGSPSVYYADAALRALRSTVGDWLALPFLPLAMTAFWFVQKDPPVPFSIYARAVKPV